ncbi:Hypothetical protein D9617_3g022270 [Elsinoe fawcettii]|nr:Hypothetical protein D9617_3g022270 [Elsinoe fawcettii]
MTEESSSLKETARESNNGPAMGPPELSAADLRKQKRFTLTLPITTNLNQFAPSGPTSPTRSIAPSITPSEDATRPTTPSEPNFLTALAAQERRVLELKEELAKAEQVLQKLKKEWAIHEVHKKRQDIRDSRRSRIPKHANQASSAASIKSEDSDTQSDMAAREAEKRRAMHYQAKTSQRKVFSGSKHARALSLLSPDPQDGAFPSTVTRDGEPSATASLVTQDGIEPHAPRVVPHQRVVSGEMQRSKSNYGPDGEIDIPREVLMRAGRQMASDFKDGLWTFLEDLRQVTVGDEAAAATSTRPRPQRPDVNVRMPQAKTGQTDKRTKAATSSPGRVQKSKRIPPPSRRGNGQAESADEGSPKDSAVGFDEQDSTGKSLVDVDVTASPTAKKTPRRRSLVKPDTRKSPNGPDDADAWDNWDSPQTAQKTQEPHRLQSRNDEAISFEQGHSDFKDLLDAADEKAGRREPIPWPALTKLPSNLKRTASHLMSEWEKSLAPLPETKHVPHPEDHYFDGMTTGRQTASRLADETPSSIPPLATTDSPISPTAQRTQPALTQPRGVKRPRHSDPHTAIQGDPSTSSNVPPSKRQRGGEHDSDTQIMRLEGQAQSRSPPHNNGATSNGSRDSNGTPQRKSSQQNGSSTNGDIDGHVPVIRPTGDFYGHDREEVTRILIQSLTDLGYHGAAGTLSRESGFELENTSVAAFRLAIQEGEWSEAEGLLFGRRPERDGGVGLKGNGHNGDELAWLRRGGAVGEGNLPVLPLGEGADQEEMLFLIRQQKYLELLEQRDLATALSVLRREITPLHRDTARLHTLTSLMMCPTADELRNLAKWDGAHGKSRDQLLSDLSLSIAPSVMIPEHRLANLFKHVQDNQTMNCLYHNTTAVPSLYHDHVCDRDDFPMDLLTELRDHHDEVWYIAFSPNGTYLATASADSHIYIYNTTSWRLVHRLNETHSNAEVQGVVSIAWSPDERYLLSCSRGNQLTVYDIQESGRRISTFTNYTYPVTSAAWLPDGQHFVVGSQDIERALVQYRLGDLSPMHEYTSREQKTRIHDLAVSTNGTRMIAISNEKRIMTWDLSTPSKTLLSDTTMDDVPQSVSVCADGSQMLVGMKGHKLYLLDTDSGEFVQSYSGQVTDQYVIRARFGGAGEGFVISGSEDSRVVVWRKQSAVQVASLDCHAPGPVNAVAWHPSNVQIFATAGDDRRVKIWASANMIKAYGSSIRNPSTSLSAGPRDEDINGYDGTSDQRAVNQPLGIQGVPRTNRAATLTYDDRPIVRNSRSGQAYTLSGELTLYRYAGHIEDTAHGQGVYIDDLDSPAPASGYANQSMSYTGSATPMNRHSMHNIPLQVSRLSGHTRDARIDRRIPSAFLESDSTGQATYIYRTTPSLMPSALVATTRRLQHSAASVAASVLDFSATSPPPTPRNRAVGAEHPAGRSNRRPNRRRATSSTPLLLRSDQGLTAFATAPGMSPFSAMNARIRAQIPSEILAPSTITTGTVGSPSQVHAANVPAHTSSRVRTPPGFENHSNHPWPRNAVPDLVRQVNSQDTFRGLLRPPSTIDVISRRFELDPIPMTVPSGLVPAGHGRSTPGSITGLDSVQLSRRPGPIPPAVPRNLFAQESQIAATLASLFPSSAFHFTQTRSIPPLTSQWPQSAVTGAVPLPRDRPMAPTGTAPMPTAFENYMDRYGVSSFSVARRNAHRNSRGNGTAIGDISTADAERLFLEAESEVEYHFATDATIPAVRSQGPAPLAEEALNAFSWQLDSLERAAAVAEHDRVEAALIAEVNAAAASPSASSAHSSPATFRTPNPPSSPPWSIPSYTPTDTATSRNERQVIHASAHPDRLADCLRAADPSLSEDLVRALARRIVEAGQSMFSLGDRVVMGRPEMIMAGLYGMWGRREDARRQADVRQTPRGWCEEEASFEERLHTAWGRRSNLSGTDAAVGWFP